MPNRVRGDGPGRLESLRRALVELEKAQRLESAIFQRLPKINPKRPNKKDVVMSSNSKEQQFMAFLGCSIVSEAK